MLHQKRFKKKWTFSVAPKSILFQISSFPALFQALSSFFGTTYAAQVSVTPQQRSRMPPPSNS
jgi:hypothetical protein